MTKRIYDLAVFVGRFQPFHNGHKRVIDEALKRATRVLVIIGSSMEPRSIRNPFTFFDRVDMIREAYSEPERSRILFECNQNNLYNDNAWIESIQECVEWRKFDAKTIALIGHARDNTSFYLKLFPQWDNIEVDDYDGVNSTDIREAMFSSSPIYSVSVPPTTWKFLTQFAITDEFHNLKEEYDFVQSYKKQWASSPYPPTFVTVDACVVQSGHVLLVKRKERPGKGLWALPGGFLNQGEKILDAVLRELREETKIKVPTPVLKGNIVTSKVFDDPNRSSRGRTITHAYLIHLPPDTKLPLVKGADDAEKAKWVPLADLEREMFFEDHFCMIQYMMGQL